MNALFFALAMMAGAALSLSGLINLLSDNQALILFALGGLMLIGAVDKLQKRRTRVD